MVNIRLIAEQVWYKLASFNYEKRTCGQKTHKCPNDLLV